MLFSFKVCVWLVRHLKFKFWSFFFLPSEKSGQIKFKFSKVWFSLFPFHRFQFWWKLMPEKSLNLCNNPSNILFIFHPVKIFLEMEINWQVFRAGKIAFLIDWFRMNWWTVVPWLIKFPQNFPSNENLISNIFKLTRRKLIPREILENPLLKFLAILRRIWKLNVKNQPWNKPSKINFKNSISHFFASLKLQRISMQVHSIFIMWGKFCFNNINVSFFWTSDEKLDFHFKSWLK